MNVTQLKRHCRKFAGAVETLHGHPSNILVYAVTDFGRNTFASILVTYAVEKVICWLRRTLGQRNISLKTMVDERFLL